MGIIETLINRLGAALDVPASAEVPSERPGQFITVERTGGGADAHGHDYPQVAVQCWAASMYEADEMAQSAAQAIARLPYVDGSIKSSTVEAVYNFPDFEGKQSRYQITASLVAVRKGGSNA
jgi:hypothetical protein